ncbi:MAG TPA: peptidylprolyl isomerase [Lacipirellulaceae bacterium]|nr:peptidylprolyl isomerase [Lacipirellulaceae bacterium]
MDKLYCCRRETRFSLFASAVFAGLVTNTAMVEAATPTSKVRLYMNIGTVEIELYGTQSPLNVANFLSYVDNRSYDNSIIHRTRDGATVADSELFLQGGSYKFDSLAGIPAGPAVANEFNASNGLSNVPYTLSAARGASLDSATSGWFINQTNNASAFDNPSSPYTVLGKVTLGTNVIDAVPFFDNLPILAGTQLESMPVLDIDGVISEVVINRAVRIPVLAGDYNMSGSVTSADYTTWRNNLGSAVNAAADGNGDGIVDGADYVIWRKAMAHGSGSGAGNVSAISAPEPTGAFLAVLGGMLLAARRSRSASPCASKMRG